MNHVVVGIGSNINARANIEKALELMRDDGTVSIEKTSRLATTPPVGFTNQPDFVNGAILVQTPLHSDALRAYLRQLEDRLGRVRTGNKYGPRTIDLDIVVCNGTVVDNDYHERSFLADAVHELIPRDSLKTKPSRRQHAP